MAKDDQDKEREEDDFFGDDDDFGLPELDYEALDDEELDNSDDLSFDDSLEEEEVSADSEDDFDDIDAAFDIDEETEGSDAIDEDSDLEAEMSAQAEESSFEEESFDDFEGGDSDFESSDDATDFDAMDEDTEVSDSDFDDSVFDSDDISDDDFNEFEKELMDSGEDLGSEEDFSDSFAEDDEYGEPVAATSEDDSGSKGKFARIVIIGVVIFSTLGALFYFLSPSSGEEEQAPVAQKAEPQKAPAKTPEQPKEEEVTPVASEQLEEDFGSQSDEGSNQPARNNSNQAASTGTVPSGNPGDVTSLSERTGNFYIVIASFVDGDLAMDHSQKLASVGQSPTIIPPFGNAITHRVAIQGYGSIGQAQSALEGYKSEFGQDVWILRY